MHVCPGGSRVGRAVRCSDFTGRPQGPMLYQATHGTKHQQTAMEATDHVTNKAANSRHLAGGSGVRGAGVKRGEEEEEKGG